MIYADFLYAPINNSIHYFVLGCFSLNCAKKTTILASVYYESLTSTRVMWQEIIFIEQQHFKERHISFTKESAKNLILY